MKVTRNITQEYDIGEVPTRQDVVSCADGGKK